MRGAGVVVVGGGPYAGAIVVPPGRRGVGTHVGSPQHMGSAQMREPELRVVVVGASRAGVHTDHVFACATGAACGTAACGGAAACGTAACGTAAAGCTGAACGTAACGALVGMLGGPVGAATAVTSAAWAAAIAAASAAACSAAELSAAISSALRTAPVALGGSAAGTVSDGIG